MENPSRNEGENSGADHVLLKDVGIPFFAEGAGFALSLDTAVYEISAVLRAVYRFTDRLYIMVSCADPPGSNVILLARAISPNVILEKTIGELLNELIDQALRCRLEKEMRPVRELLTAQAFAEGNLLHE